MTNVFEDGTERSQEELDEYLAGIMDNYLAECEASPVRFLAVTNNGRTYKVRMENNVIWFPSLAIKARKKQ